MSRSTYGDDFGKDVYKDDPRNKVQFLILIKNFKIVLEEKIAFSSV